MKDLTLNSVMTALHRAFVIISLSAVIGCGNTPQSDSVDASATTLTISGPTAVTLGSTASFQVQPHDTDLEWSVNGVEGGSTSTGTIASGIYQAPATIGATDTVTITCSDSKKQSAQKIIQLQNPVPVISNAQRSQGGGVMAELVLSGDGFLPTSQVVINGVTFIPTSASATQLIVSVPITLIPSYPISVVISNPSPGGGDSNTFEINGTAPSVTIKAAARFLDQATFGPIMSDIQHVQTAGFQGYLTEQFSEPASLIPVEPPYLGLTGDCRPFVLCWTQGWWIKYALWAPDQLRQRVAYALSEQWVVSTTSVNPYYMQTFQNVFISDAFGNWRKLMQDVTLSPAMGTFLNMVNSVAPSQGKQANQNYARELMQLFNLGPDRLNEDGSLQLDSNGNPIPLYTPAQIDAFSRAFTGWTYQREDSDLKCTPSTQPIPDNYAGVSGYGVTGFTCPMAALSAYHDQAEKVLLDGVVLPAGQTPLEDLNGALDDIFNNSNLPPFVAKQLIQHLVMSNPPPEYIRRVANVFKDDGHGVRGNMKAVISAILLDPDARTDDAYGQQTEYGGRLREPLLWMVSVARSLGAQDAAPGMLRPLGGYLYFLPGLGETLFEPADVNGYFSPGYMIPGTSLFGPEFQLESTASIPTAQSIISMMVNGHFNDSLTLDFSSTGQLGQLDAESPEALVTYLDIVMVHGDMPLQMRTDVLNVVRAEDPAKAVKDAIYLIATSPEYKVTD